MTPPAIIYRSDVRPTLEEAQAFVGGYVELIQLPGGNRQMLVREDGLLIKGLETNPEASHIVQNESLIMLSQRGIVGNAMILEGAARWTVEGDMEEAYDGIEDELDEGDDS